MNELAFLQRRYKRMFDESAMRATVKGGVVTGVTVSQVGTAPPPKHRNKRHHWLISERASSPCISEWIDGQWWSAGEADLISPAEMYRRGWRWGAVAKPPKRLLA